ncbi:hypothetical protein ACO1O0_004965 [Amphichorda felina]
MHSSSHSLSRPPDAQVLMQLLAQEQLAQQARGDDPALGEGVQSEVDEDEIWRVFLLDGDRTEITRKAVEEAMDTTRRHLLQPEEKMASDMAEAPSLAPDSIPMTLSGADNILLDPPSLPVPATQMEMPTFPSGTPTDTVTSVAAEQGSPNLGTEEQQSADYKFHQPRPFIGRLASTGDGPRQPRSPLKRRRGRPRKKRDQRRPDFRAMPNFDGDPIESEEE